MKELNGRMNSMMNLSLKELNNLYYCVGMMRMRLDDGRMISDSELDVLLNLLRSEIDMKFGDDYCELIVRDCELM